MKSAFAFTLSLLVLSAGSVYAQRPEKVAQALRERYETEQTQIVGQPREVNGVKLYEVEVRGREGSSKAYLTEFGDFLSSGSAANFSKLPQAVRDLRDLFRTKPENVDTYVSDSYVFDLRRGSDNRIYRLRVNAVAQLREIINPDDVAKTDPARYQKASNDIQRKIGDQAKSRAAQGAKLRDVFRDPINPEFYIANYTAAGGKNQYIDLDENGAMLWSRTEIDMRDVPAPIRDTFEKMFESTKVQAVYRLRTEFQQFQQKAENGDIVTLRVRPDGTIIDIRSTDLPEENQAQAAGARTPAERRDTSNDNRNRPNADDTRRNTTPVR